MIKHNSYPWHVVGERSRTWLPSVFGADGKSICQTMDSTKQNGARPSKEHRANARLIAAAPDLLEACQRMNEDSPNRASLPFQGDYYYIKRENFERMKKAVAKATGKIKHERKKQ